MTIIDFFVHQTSGSRGERFLKIIQEDLNYNKINVTHNFEEFDRTLKRQHDSFNKKIIVLFIDNAILLNRLTKRKDMLRNERTVIILHPDAKEENISQISQFSPSYFTFIDDHYSDLCAVLKKMVTQ
jgi:hypothetical protein